MRDGRPMVAGGISRQVLVDGRLGEGSCSGHWWQPASGTGQQGMKQMRVEREMTLGVGCDFFHFRSPLSLFFSRF